MMPIFRRQFLSAAAGVVGVTFADPLRGVMTVKPLPIIDTHQHLWDFVHFKPPWLSGADPKMAAKHDTSDYQKASAGLNLVQAVYMEIDVAPKDQVKEANYAIELCKSKEHPTSAAVISGRPDSEQFAEYIGRYKDSPYIKGVRQVLHADAAPKGLCLRPQFVNSIRLLGEMGMSFDLCMRPTELADGAALARECPETRFIVDHCGNADPKAWMKNTTAKPSHTLDAWKRDIASLAKRKNVVCKISGIVARAPQDWSSEHLAPIIDFCLDEFGPYRVLFGGDWPVCKLRATLGQWVKSLKEIVSERPHFEQKFMFHDNARTFYGLS
jgi:predicted TIM-barrel fold metal-dependent hydrolase